MQTVSLLSFIFLEVSVTPVLLQNIPSYVQLCKRNDPKLSECFINSVNTIRPYLIKGIPEMDLPQGEPLYYFNATANLDAEQAALVVKVWNQQADGLMNFDLKSVNIDLDNAKCTFDIFFPNARLQGEYSFQGKLFLFEIDTSGYYKLNSTGISANTKFVGRYHTKKGKQHIEFDEVSMKLEVGDAQIYFTNLINGNEQLTATVNQAVNENIHTFINELRPIIEETLAGFVKMYINAVFRLFPVNTLFPSE
ncbi:hypothetical protein RN001_008438 [Aquatica leii]|uniref:Uncharacterized protein n=1 Tax=Aquatica leii TaxID=1421715 RepID=A0AAN7SGP9_9COLE|nr:hypothetical protein RN001_008438 [Aquatica leii]